MIPPTRSTVDAIAVAVESVDPAWLHARAARFDEADERLGTIADGFRAVMREVVEVWRRYEAGGAPPALGERSTQALRQIDELRSREPGDALRRAADSLAWARLELRDLRAAGSAEPGGAAAADERAVAVLNRVSQDFVETGGHLLALPYGPAGADITGRGVVPTLSTVEGGSMALAGESTMALAAADDLGALSARDFGGGLSGLSSLPDGPNSSSPPMMPFMPMGAGMGMGAMNQAVGKERQPGGSSTADPGSWREPDDGWETVGRRGRPDETAEATKRATVERQAQNLIDGLRDGRRDPMARR